jgi:hypothetical protein
MTKEQILTAIAQAVESGTIEDLDTGFITTVKTINGKGLKFFVGQQSEYEALTAEEKENLLAVITNETIAEDLIAEITRQLRAGEIVVKEAESATEAKRASRVVPHTKVDLCAAFGVSAFKGGEDYYKTFTKEEFNQYFPFGSIGVITRGRVSPVDEDSVLTDTGLFYSEIRYSESAAADPTTTTNSIQYIHFHDDHAFIVVRSDGNVRLCLSKETDFDWAYISYIT